jgi:hypothetical protein
MDIAGLEQVAKVLQMSLSPVALISGVGLLLISMNSAKGRPTHGNRLQSL